MSIRYSQKKKKSAFFLWKNAQFASFLSSPKTDFLDTRFFHKSSGNMHKYNYIFCSCQSVPSSWAIWPKFGPANLDCWLRCKTNTEVCLLSRSYFVCRLLKAIIFTDKWDDLGIKEYHF